MCMAVSREHSTAQHSTAQLQMHLSMLLQTVRRHSLEWVLQQRQCDPSNGPAQLHIRGQTAITVCVPVCISADESD